MTVVSDSSYLLFVGGYLVLLVLMGLFLGKREVGNSDDFMVAGRRLPLLVLVGTLLATWVGGGTVTGSANFIYTYGPFAGLLFFIGAPAGIVILFFVAGKVRALARYTVPQILEMRYGSLARFLSAICIMLAYLGIISYQFKGGGYVLNLTTGMDLQTGTIISAFVMVLLAVTGGMVTIAYTDFFSALLIVGGMGIGLPFVFGKAGSWSSILGQLSPAQLSWSGGLSTVQLLGYILPLIFLILGDQNMFQRFGCAKDAKTAARSNVGFFIGEWLVIGLAVTYATAAIVLFPGIRPDTAILQMAMGGVPFVIGGVILAAAVAFMITTGDSFLLSTATNVVYDIIQKYFKPDMTEREKIVYTRVCIVALGLLAYVIGTYFPDILKMQMYSYSMYGAAITPALLAAILWPGVSKAGGLASIVTGGAAVLIWEIVLKRPLGWNAILVAAPMSILVLIVVSLVTGRRPETAAR